MQRPMSGPIASTQLRAAGSVIPRSVNRGDAVGVRHRPHRLDEGLAVTGRLPDLGQVVPDVLRVGGTGDVGDPRADEVGAGGGQALDVPAAPVVADQVDRPVERLQLGDQPGQVVVGRRREVGIDGRAETGRRQRHDVVAPEHGPQRVPDGRGLGVAMDEHDGHGTPCHRRGDVSVRILVAPCDSRSGPARSPTIGPCSRPISPAAPSPNWSTRPSTTSAPRRGGGP